MLKKLVKHRLRSNDTIPANVNDIREILSKVLPIPYILREEYFITHSDNVRFENAVHRWQKLYAQLHTWFIEDSFLALK